VPLKQVADTIFAETQTLALMITRSEEGISLFTPKNLQLDFPVIAKPVRDVTGAGDTVLATLAYAIANQLPLPVAIELSNLSAGIAIEQFGCAQVTMAQLAKRLLENNCSSKVFDEKHLHPLKQALGNTPYTLIEMTGHAPICSQLMAQLAKIKQESGHVIIASIRGKIQDDMVHMASLLKPIDFIVLNAPQEALLEHFPNLSKTSLS
jgi:D-beta-D-heptose 7-phosphate kinase/D-beta-D-heptose 1-phosphate adenosyltransferase